MEIFRQVGIEPAIREVAIPHSRNVLWASSLAGEEIVRRPVETMTPETVRHWSPTWGCTSAQDNFEPVFLAQARLRLHGPAQIRLNTQLLTFEQHEGSVLARLLDRPSGQVREVRAQYLIGADGAHSTVREILGIGMLGQSVLTHSINILFHADLARWVGDREIDICFITNPHAAGLLLPNGGDRWRFTAFYYPDKGEHPEDYTAERCLHLIRTAVGVPDLLVELDGVFPWSDAALVAERFGEGRAFLVGDAEHLMAPAGGFGMSVGIQDAHNLAWKIAWVLKGWAAPGLLATYEMERAPISRRMVEQMARNALSARGTSRERSGTDAAGTSTSRTPPTSSSSPARPAGAASPPLGRPEFFREHGLVFGATYESGAIVPDGTAPVQVANPVTDYVPGARPGSRAPHVWLQGNELDEPDGPRISVIDLFGRDMVLLAGADGQSWCEAALQIARELGIPLQAFRVGLGRDLSDMDADNSWADTYGVQPDGAVLVRPDGYVAWRTNGPATNKIVILEEVLSRVLALRSAADSVILHQSEST